MSLGFVAGPVQPVSAELAVEVSYPCDETAVESTQQIFGNLASALVIPVAGWAGRNVDLNFGKMPWDGDIRGDVVLLAALVAVCGAVYSGFGGELKRSMVDCGGEVRKLRERGEEREERRSSEDCDRRKEPSDNTQRGAARSEATVLHEQLSFSTRFARRRRSKPS